jgi:hypothetical protein
MTGDPTSQNASLGAGKGQVIGKKTEKKESKVKEEKAETRSKNKEVRSKEEKQKK